MRNKDDEKERNKRDKEMATLRKAGWTYRRIAEAFGITERWVIMCLSKRKTT